MRNVFSGSLVAAALGTAVMIAGALPASAQISNALATGDNGGLLTLVKNEKGGGGHADRGGAATMRGSSGLSSRAQGDVRLRNDRMRADRGDRRQMSNNRNWSNNNNWNNNGNWRRHRHYGNGVGIGLGFYGYNAPYYAYQPGYYAYGAAGVDDDAVAYCMSRFQSYDPNTGTYLGYDGFQHPCP